MRVLILMAALLLASLVLRPSVASADSRCITLEGSTLVNSCQDCMEVTAHELWPTAEQTAGLFTGASRTVRLEGLAREALHGSESWVITDLKACH
jgi:hypothetical protein